jgi:branched-chain amino acid transport system substrate-binding protein
MRMQLMMEALAQSIEKAQSLEAGAIAQQLERTEASLAGHGGRMRAADHQFQQDLRVVIMDRQGSPGVRFDAEGSGYGFRVIKTVSAEQAQQDHSCKMMRPSR